MLFNLSRKLKSGDGLWHSINFNFAFKGNHLDWKPELIKAVEEGGLRIFIICWSHLNKTWKK